MDLSLFLARSWGLFMVLVCLGIFVNKKRFLGSLGKADDGAFFLIGILLIGIGVAHVVGYEVWEFSWRGLVTLFGWSSLGKGLLILFVPGYSERFMKFAMRKQWYTLSLVCGLVLGAYLLYAGYLMH